MAKKVLVIGCGGVAQVAIQKLAKRDDVFSDMRIVSRTVSKCDAMKEKLEKIVWKQQHSLIFHIKLYLF